ncbi:MAG: hypothetical protein HWN66_15335 [Candidatus Helarchaeota archaeon]|nr:hypothetical protein [Candidatus Helarchaeota archaeon]
MPLKKIQKNGDLMGAARVLVGMLFCLAASILIVFFVTLGYAVGNFSDLGDIIMFQAIFALLLSPLTAINMGLWSVIAALAVGGLLGGLVSKSPTAGLVMGLLSFLVIFILFLGITVGFDIDAWITWVTSWDSYIVVDVVLSLGLLAGIGAIGGKLTAESD